VANVPEQDQMEAKRKAALELLETQKKRLEQLNGRRQKIQVTVEAARQQYDQAVQESVAEHETADLADLRAKLVKLETENTNVLAEFVQAVDQYEAFIVRIESALSDPEAMSALLASLSLAGAALAAPTSETASAALAFDEADI
jgi:chromosome segregation ATPase